MMLRVGLDGYGLEDGSRHRGIGTYLRRLIGGLVERPDVDFAVIAGRSADLPDGARRVPITSYAPTRFRAAERRLRLPGAIRRSGADLFHSAGQLVPGRSPVPLVQTLHDLTPLYYRHPLLERERTYWLGMAASLRAAAAIICPSRSSADQVVRYLDIDPQRVHVVPHGVDPTFRPDGPPADVAGPYLMWASTWGPHKGLDEALAAFGSLVETGYPHRFVVAGYQEGAALQRVREAVAASGHADRVVVPGWVPDVAALYRGADALVVTSRAEGFGFPALEAMACGTPVVSFDNTSLPEVVGDAGMLVADGDVDALAAALRRVLDEESTARDLRAAGLVRAAEHTWERAVDAHIAVYREAVAG